MPKILLLDIETTPNLVYVWRFFKENVGANQIVENSQVMSYAAKWLHLKEVYYADQSKNTEDQLVEQLLNLLDEADIVIMHNGDRFDLPRIKGRALVLGLSPPSPVKTIDTLKVARKNFAFGMNNLGHLADILGVQKKLTHKNFPGFLLWVECMKNNPKAWEECRVYNIGDVITLQAIYLKMLPWIDNHPNLGIFEERDVVVCPKCGSESNQRRGYFHTNTGKYQRYRCNDCGGWHRERYTEYSKELRKSLAVNAK